jgi:hypothetical protein
VLADPTTVDLIVAHRDGTVILAIFEEREWDGSDERLGELEQKINAYLTFVLDGHMERQHPELQPRQVRIRLDYTNRMDERTRAVLPAIEATLAEHGIDFAISHMTEIQAG